MHYFDWPEPYFGDPEPGAPASIEHKCDYMLTDDRTECEFHYNFFVYHWIVQAHAFHGRCYADDMDRVSIFLPYAKLNNGNFDDVIRWLQRRFFRIDTFELEGSEKGYVTRWQLGPPVQGDTA